MTNGKHKIHGGLLFEAMPFGEIEQLPLPDTVTISIPDTAPVTVAIGERVLTGQPLTQVNENSVVSHASISGIVTAVVTDAVTISSDNRDEAYKHNNSTNDYQSLFQTMGLVGLGGAAFPVFKKLQSARDAKPTSTLLINAAECDPAIYCDEALIQQCAADVAKGIQIAHQATEAKNCIVGMTYRSFLYQPSILAELSKHFLNYVPAKTVLCKATAQYVLTLPPATPCIER